MASKMESLRLRLEFNSHILTDAQISQGLHKTWIFAPFFPTVDALSTYISQTFHLHHSCPHGLLLYMDGFVLPPFESTSILKDKDVISVKKKEVPAILGNGTVQKLPGNTGALLLANEEFDSESGGRREESLENGGDKSLEGNVYLEDGNKISKKRKALEKSEGLKKKKQRSEPHETAANDVLPEPVARDHENGVLAGKKNKSSKKNQTNAGTIENSDEKVDKDVESTPKSKQKSSKKIQTTVGTLEYGDVKIDKDVESTPKSKQKKKRRSEPHISAANDVHVKSVEGHHENGVAAVEKSASKKRKSSKKTQSNLGPNENGDEEIDKDVDSTPKSKRNEQVLENCKDIDGNTNVSESSPKGQSRSARRKKAKRKWLKEMANIKKKSVDSQEVKNWKEMQSSAGGKKSVSLLEKEVTGHLEKEVLGNPKGLLHWKQWGENSKTWSKPEEENQNHNKHGCSNRNSCIANEVVPIEIRPGHIRFEASLEDADHADHAAQRSQAAVLSVETFHWNGITSKKKGQRWGRDQGYVSHGQFKQAEEGETWGADTYPVHHGKDYEQSKQGEKNQREKDIYSVSHGNDNDQTLKENEMHADTHTHFSEQMDFDKLPPLPGFPKEGDVIAYRLVELSSSWTPEMSSFRVGKVSRFNCQSSKIMLVPLPEYPMVFEKSEEEESTEQHDGNLYNEDGSLEIEFTSLVDVRIVKSGDLDPSALNGNLDQGNGGSVCTNNMETPKLPGNKAKSANVVQEDQGKAAAAPSTGNGGNLWEEFSEALNAKKEELKGSRSSSWSHRVLKGSTLGPTMAFLRSENNNKNMVM